MRWTLRRWWRVVTQCWRGQHHRINAVNDGGWFCPWCGKKVPKKVVEQER